MLEGELFVRVVGVVGGTAATEGLSLGHIAMALLVLALINLVVATVRVIDGGGVIER